MTVIFEIYQPVELSIDFINHVIISLWYSFFMGKRVYREGQLFHIVNRGNRKRRIFYRDRDYVRFKKLLRRYEAKHTVVVCGYCLMPNHYHLLLEQGNGGSISKFMQGLGIAYTLYMNKRYSLVGHLFQGRYQAREITTGSSRRRIVAYLKNNPVKENLVEESHMYKWLEIRFERL